MSIEHIAGGLHVDDRGAIAFVNDFEFTGVNRFYTITSHQTNVLRGWVGHRLEHKWFIALAGSWVVYAVAPDDWSQPSKDLPVQKFVLSGLKPSVLHIPPGYANASLMLTPKALLGVFSSGRIEDTSKDDFRFDTDYWAI